MFKIPKRLLRKPFLCRRCMRDDKVRYFKGFDENGRRVILRRCTRCFEPGPDGFDRPKQRRGLRPWPI